MFTSSSANGVERLRVAQLGSPAISVAIKPSDAAAGLITSSWRSALSRVVHPHAPRQRAPQLSASVRRHDHARTSLNLT